MIVSSVRDAPIRCSWCCLCDYPPGGCRSMPPAGAALSFPRGVPRRHFSDACVPHDAHGPTFPGRCSCSCTSACIPMREDEGISRARPDYSRAPEGASGLQLFSDLPRVPPCRDHVRQPALNGQRRGRGRGCSPAYPARCQAYRMRRCDKVSGVRDEEDIAGRQRPCPD
jgi:hypothetical protein